VPGAAYLFVPEHALRGFAGLGRRITRTPRTLEDSEGGGGKKFKWEPVGIFACGSILSTYVVHAAQTPAS